MASPSPSPAYFTPINPPASYKTVGSVAARKAGSATLATSIAPPGGVYLEDRQVCLPESTTPTTKTQALWRAGTGTTCLPPDPSLNVCLDPNITDPTQVAMMVRQKLSGDPEQMKEGQGALAYAIKHHPEEIARSLNVLEKTLPPEAVEELKLGVIAVLHDMKGMNDVKGMKYSDEETKKAFFDLATTIENKDLKREAIACYHEVTKPTSARDSLPTPIQPVTLSPGHDGPRGPSEGEDKPVALTIASSGLPNLGSGITSTSGRVVFDPPILSIESPSIKSSSVPAIPMARPSSVPPSPEAALEHRAVPISIATGQTPTEPSTGTGTAIAIGGTAIATAGEAALLRKFAKGPGGEEADEPFRDGKWKLVEGRNPARHLGTPRLGDRIGLTATGDEGRFYRWRPGERPVLRKTHGATPRRSAKPRTEEAPDLIVSETPLPIFVPTFPPVIPSPQFAKSFVGAGKRGYSEDRGSRHDSDHRDRDGRDGQDDDRGEDQRDQA